ncbi:hypothetical protein [Amnibacterium kyonggiense]|uniref:Sulfotransferase family protein n=1 Tax=Amnibacterium kyonggiense TaxID=595671 RepID=A0A4R7FQ48_9MICO|nr:hypothetical protein [Amnibacterium kyonggiense]TDS79709.1 hypothetical protein CLV52_0246 [Amnibacterium kyonggiense]
MTEPLPDGTRLLHIGPAKTGTTSLQSGFHHNREALAAHGVHYAGRGSQPRAAAGAVALGRRIAGHHSGLEAWPKLVDEVNGSTARMVVISSETFARANDARAKDVIDAFGAGRTHVVITMRPLVDMLSSSWQQYVQTGSRTSYPKWLESMLLREDTLHGSQPEFWQKTRVDALARRWATLVGPERVTVVSLADAPRDFVLRTFETLTGLPDGTLVPDPKSDNVSLSHPLAEVVRRFNERFHSLPGSSADVQAVLIEFGAIRALREHPELLRSDQRIEVPQWAADRAGELMADMVAGVRDAGVRTVGDLDALVAPSRAPVPTVEDPSTVSIDAAAELLVGMMTASAHGMPRFDSITGRAPADLNGVGTRELVTYTARRLVTRTRERLRSR